jgi:hypothetical protein
MTGVHVRLRARARSKTRWEARAFETARASIHQLGVTDVRFDFFDQFRRHLANAVFLGVLTGFLKYFFDCLTTYDVLAPTRRVHLGAFQNLCHGLASLIQLLICLL